jgi:aminopeptidase-like protein
MPLEECASFYSANGETMMALTEELFPICRSITGNGVRQTLAILQRYVPLEVNEVPSGIAVFDWTGSTARPASISRSVA